MPTLTLVAERTPVKAYEVATLGVTIGRGEDMDIVIVEDLNSANGTFVNGQRLTVRRTLARGDEISFGKFSLFFDRALRAPVQARAIETRPNLPRATGTFHMDQKDVELRRLAALDPAIAACGQSAPPGVRALIGELRKNNEL